MSGLDHRRLAPEILDGLTADDPRAIASRRDLSRINRVMFQAKIMASLFRDFVPAPPRRILEIGAGDGRFMLAVARRMARRWPDVEVLMLDRVSLVTAELRSDFDRLGWRIKGITADVFDWADTAEGEQFDAIATNLFLHHFDDAQLLHLFSRMMPRAPLFLANEPWRASLPLASTYLVWAIGANDVTRNDAPQSVRAGFRGSELSHLWEAANGKSIKERRAGLFSHIFVGASADAGLG
jgi:2-polyprenyl-3-methyl-5-hydroxy-6-metoxy-1,4-benzoquinol methylase